MWSALIGGAANLIGGALNRSAGEKANEMAANQAAMQIQAQERFAQNSLQWRADDVMAAYKRTGIHPLAMLGVQGSTYSPVTTAFTPASMGDSIARAGQDVSRAITAGADRELRARQIEMQEIQMNNAAERGFLENELLKVRIASERANLSQPGTGPGIPVPKGAAKSVTALGLPTERYTNPDVSFTDTSDKGLAPVKGKEAQGRLEDDFLGNIWWNIRNRIMPVGQKKLLGKASPGMYWDYDVVRGAWYQRPYPWTTEAPIKFDKRR